MFLECVAVGNRTGNVRSGQGSANITDLYRQGLAVDRNLLGRTILGSAVSVLQ